MLDFSLSSILDKSMQYDEIQNINDIFPKNYTQLFFDKEAMEDIGEEETIYKCTKIGWHIEDYSNFVSKTPMMYSNPSFTNLYLPSIDMPDIPKDYSKDSALIKEKLTK
jgi:hypothetical protein